MLDQLKSLDIEHQISMLSQRFNQLKFEQVIETFEKKLPLVEKNGYVFLKYDSLHIYGSNF